MNQHSSSRIVQFVGGALGPWRIDQLHTVTGPPLITAARLAITSRQDSCTYPYQWALLGCTSNQRYTNHLENAMLNDAAHREQQSPATHAALIPIRKNDTWWTLPQDERRAIFETRSHHISTGSSYVPAIARTLYHSRDLEQPFDFLTWFQYAGTDVNAFEDLLGKLRATEEWSYVDREIDLRLSA